MTHEDDARTLYSCISDAFGRSDGSPVMARAVLEVAESAEPALISRPPSHYDAETCRLASLAGSQCERFDRADVWRARALARGAALGWRELIGALVVAEAFRRLAQDNERYTRGITFDVLTGSPAAVQIIQEVKVLLDGPPSTVHLGPGCPTSATLRRFLHEKGAFLQLAAGDLVVVAVSSSGV